MRTHEDVTILKPSHVNPKDAEVLKLLSGPQRRKSPFAIPHPTFCSSVAGPRSLWLSWVPRPQGALWLPLLCAVVWNIPERVRMSIRLSKHWLVGPLRHGLGRIGSIGGGVLLRTRKLRVISPSRYLVHRHGRGSRPWRN